MEILPGHSLAKVLRHEPILAVPRAARIASQMLIALELHHPTHSTMATRRQSRTSRAVGYLRFGTDPSARNLGVGAAITFAAPSTSPDHREELARQQA
jgi:hypothetical protein